MDAPELDLLETARDLLARLHDRAVGRPLGVRPGLTYDDLDEIRAVVKRLSELLGDA